jgi:tetratricopeptide (TPR) repeat protein
LLDRGEKDVAIELLAKSISLDPNNPDTWATIGRAHSLNGDIDQAISAYRAATILNPNLYWPYHLLAEIYENQGDWEQVAQQAETAFENAQTINQKVDNGFLLFKAYEHLNEIETACSWLLYIQEWEDEFDDQIMSSQLFCDPGYQRIKELLDQGNFKIVFSETLEIIESGDLNVQSIDTLVILVGDQLGDFGYVKEAYTLFHRGYIAHGNPELIKEVNDLLTNSVQGSLIDDSITVLDQILADDNIPKEDRASIANHIGRLLSDNNEHNHAIDILNQATILSPEFSEAWTNLGYVYSRQGQSSQAIASYKKAIDIDPNKYWPNQLLAGLYYAQGEWQDAILYAENAFQSASSDDLKVKSLLLLASTFTNLGDTIGACENLEIAYQLQDSSEIQQKIETLSCENSP